MDKKYQFDLMLFVGRMQPPHQAHIDIINRALDISAHVIILIGSADQPRTIKNPWKWREREDMIRACFPPKVQDRMIFFRVVDVYSNQEWVRSIQEIVDVVGDKISDNIDLNIGMVGHKKDNSSFYLDMFPQWELLEVDMVDDIHSTDIRHNYFTESEQVFDDYVDGKLPEGIHRYLKAFMMSEEFDQLKAEYTFNIKYKQAWDWNATLDAFLDNEGTVDFPVDNAELVHSVIESLRTNYTVAPYPNNFYCADAVVVQSGHVLLVRRRSEPGKNLWAVPGGHIGPSEESLPAAIRELREETKLKVPAPVLEGSLDKNKPFKLFENPSRSLRGRTLSMAYHFVLRDGPLHKVVGSDDADRAKWVPLSVFENMQDQMFEDHWLIVKYFTG